MHKNRKRFHRLSVKFILGITGILLLILTATLFINSRVMERYYLHRQRENVRQAGETLKKALARGMHPGGSGSGAGRKGKCAGGFFPEHG